MSFRLNNAELEGVMDAAISDAGIKANDECPEGLIHPETLEFLRKAVQDEYHEYMKKIEGKHGRIPVVVEKFACDGKAIKINARCVDSLANMIALRTHEHYELLGVQASLETHIQQQAKESQEEPFADDEEMDDEVVDDHDDGKLLSAKIEVGNEIVLTDDATLDEIEFPAGRVFEVKELSGDMIIIQEVSDEDDEDELVGDGEPFEVSVDILNEVFEKA